MSGLCPEWEVCDDVKWLVKAKLEELDGELSNEMFSGVIEVK